jgi:hypothetical protein
MGNAAKAAKAAFYQPGQGVALLRPLKAVKGKSCVPADSQVGAGS